MPKLNRETIRLLRREAEATHAVGSERVATALDLLLEWHDRQGPRMVEPTEEMVDAALAAWNETRRIELGGGRDKMVAAIRAALAVVEVTRCPAV